MQPWYRCKNLTFVTKLCRDKNRPRGDSQAVPQFFRASFIVVLDTPFSCLFAIASATVDMELAILYKQRDAVGGMGSWSEIKRICPKRSIDREGKIVDFCIVKKLLNKIRAVVTVPISDFGKKTVQMIRAHDGKTAWVAPRYRPGQPLQTTQAE